MIEDPPVLKIRRDFPRPAAAQVAEIENTPIGFLVDAMHGRGAMAAAVKPLATDGSMPMTFCGPAYTCWCSPNDNLGVLAALKYAQPGDVIVAACEGFETAAVIGDRVLGMARNKGVVAFVTDGMVRDHDGLIGIGTPVFCAGITPNSPVRFGPGTAGLPVSVGGVTVNPGDLIAGDRDGVVVVPAAMLAQVAQALPHIRQVEDELDTKVAEGLAVPGFLEEILATKPVEFVD